MKHPVKKVFAVLVTLAMLFGMTTPADAWLSVSSGRMFISLDGVYWFDYLQEANWLHPAASVDYITVYSPDGLYWYTAEGLVRYCAITDTSDPSLVCRSTDDEFVSPDDGNLWLYRPLGTPEWREWSDYWNVGDVYNSAPYMLYRVPGFEIYSTNPIPGMNCDMVSTESMGLRETDCDVSANLTVSSDSRSFVLISANAMDWKTELTQPDFDAVSPMYGYNSDTKLIPVSYDPQSRSFQKAVRMGSQVVIDPSFADPNQYTICRTVYLRAIRECTATLSLDCSLTGQCRALFCTLNAESLGIYPDTPISCGNSYGSLSYHPLTPAMQGSTIIDCNYNGIVDAADSLTDIALGDAVFSTDISSAQYAVHLMPDAAYSVSFCCWLEGQAPDCVGKMNASADYRLNILPSFDAEEQTSYPLSYVPNETGVTITNFDDNYLMQYADGIAGDRSSIGVFYNPQSHTLTLPQTIAGQNVTRIGDGAFVTAGMLSGIGDMQIILPNTVQQIGTNVFSPIVSRIHVPFNAEVSPDMFVGRIGATICCDTPNSLAQQTLAGNGNYTFLVCTGHDTLHTHTYTLWQDDPDNTATCTRDGLQTRICTGCGDTQTREIAAFGHDWGNCTVVDKNFHQRVCARCDRTETEDHTFDTLLVEPTCTEIGYTVYTCADCGYSTTDKETSALGHYFGEWVVTTPATVQETGEETRACIRCGETQTRLIDKLPVTAKFSVTGGRARRGETVQVSVELSENPGIVATMLHLSYDPQALTLTAVDNGSVFDSEVFQPGGDFAAVPFTVFWQDALALEDNTANGRLVTFTFAVSEDAPLGETPVTITYEPDSTFNKQLQNAVFTVENDGITVYDRMPGDANGDGSLDLKDVANLSRYLAGGWNIEVDERNADVDGDGQLTLKDIVLLRRYLAGGWGVELK